jgi:predicted DNA-binding protein (MmcQ/YjbR family)
LLLHGGRDRRDLDPGEGLARAQRIQPQQTQDPRVDFVTRMKRASRPKVTEAALLPRLRRICLRLPGTLETTSWGHPTFKAGGKTFCVIETYKGHVTLCFKLPAADAAAALSDARFFKSPYVGDKGWVSLIVERAPDWAEVAEPALKSYCETAPDALRAQLLGEPARKPTRTPRRP